MEVEIWTKPDLKDWWGIRPAGNHSKTRRTGWIRRQQNAPTPTYLMKIYNAQFVSEGIVRGAITDCKAFSSLKEAKEFIYEYFENLSSEDEWKYLGRRNKQAEETHAQS
jgi:hypothetical protein|tara:strand:- start:53 stop:379 length:327 start_codon:yes stop_codon:yes gene_type:complete